MTVRDLAPGARVTYRDEVLVVGRHRADAAFSWLHKHADPSCAVCLPSYWEVEAGEVIDRCRGPEPARTGRPQPPRNRLGSGPSTTARRGSPGRDPSRRSPEGATPGVLMHEVVDPPSQIEDVVDLGFIEGLAVLLTIGGIAWTVGDFPAFQGPLALVGAAVLWAIGRVVRRGRRGAQKR